VDEYLSEKEQIEQIREWWRENGWYLIGGAVAAGLAYFGYGQYQAYQSQQAGEASALYAQMQQLVAEDRPGSDALLNQLTNEYSGSPYVDQARLLLARGLVVSDPSRAATELRTVMDSSNDPQLAMVARMRLARVLNYQQRYDEALAVLDVDAPGEFAAQMKAIEGDVHVARGAIEEARQAYTAALTMQGAEGLDRNLLQIKLGDLTSATVPDALPDETEDSAGAVE
jgi:predicted negative regulator of RcsB-dependent stress response